jgi:transcriptional regulator with XRE-family HTH domain
MPTRKFRELLEAMPADRQRRIEERFRKSLAAMPLGQLRKAQEMTQLQLAGILGVNQGEVSKVERRSDICVSTLAEYIEAMGGRLEIRAVFKDREVRITQFEEPARSAETGK